MQTWSNPTIRGVQAALVTGGMLAEGSGAASATGQCPNRPPQHLEEPALSPIQDPSTKHLIRCFAGELFPEQQHDQRHTARHHTTNEAAPPPMASQAGTLDARSRSRHASAGRHRSAQPPATSPSRDTAPEPFGDAETRPNLLPSDPPEQNSSRSMSWAGSIGEVIADAAAKHSRQIITPSADPAVFTGFAEPDGILGLWRSALGQPIVSPDTVDLTNVDFAGPAQPRPAPHLVPDELLSRALTTQPVAASGEPDVPPVGKIPLAIPGERQLRVTELPPLGPEFPLLSTVVPVGDSAPAAQQAAPRPAGRAPAAATAEPGEATQPRIQPVPSEPKYHSAGQWHGPPASHITRALSGAPAQARHEPGPVRQHVARQDGPPRQGGNLPTVRGVPRIDAAVMRAETRPLPALTDAVLNELETTMPIQRLAVRS